MANVLISEDSMTAIANAIRTKKGVSTTYKPAQMPDAISSISTGGITPTGTKSITANGTYDVTNFASAEVNVPTGGVTPTGTKQISITQNGTTTEDVASYANAQITVNVQTGGASDTQMIERTGTSLINTGATIVGAQAFQGYTTLTYVELPNVTTIGNNAFNGCTNLETIKLPRAVSCGQASFYQTKARTVVLPSMEIIGYQAFRVAQIETADILGGNQIASMGFGQTSNFSKLIIRKADAITPLAAVNGMGGKFADGSTGGILYVPQALISDYQSATNWSTILGYANNQILPIEGSIYKTQYADGTPISA